MRWSWILGCAIFLGADAVALGAQAAPRTFSYAVTHALYGPIGTYDRTIDDANGVTHAKSQLKITVKILGIVVHRESATQTEAWSGGRLTSFESATLVDGRPLNVHGEAQGDRFLVTSPSGAVVAPADVVASDPLSLSRMGSGFVVSIKSGRIDPVVVRGGETEMMAARGVQVRARHYHVDTRTQPNKWEVWIDPQGVPIKFRSIETGGAVDFTLVSSRVAAGPSPLEFVRF
jgi:hypothetical protein